MRSQSVTHGYGGANPFNRPMARIDIWGGKPHFVPVTTELNLALMIEQFPLALWDALKPEQRQAFHKAHDVLCQTIQDFTLGDAGL